MNKFSRERVKGFLHTDGRRMVNEDGDTIILRGWGAGGWLNPEGYMNAGVPLFTEVGGFNDFALPRRFERGRTVESTVRELCGTAYAKDFMRRWQDIYLSEEDIKTMAELGYNSVRLSISARLFLAEEPEITWLEEGFFLLNRALDWCEKYKIYAIIDLHGAPGGQSALACDDGLDNRPHMFTEPESKERAILLWEEIARRYKDRWIVGGYDLINEPLSGPDCRKYIPLLGEFYDELIPRIRRIDKNHMLTLEGAVFSMDMDIFDHDFDPECHNWCIHTHFYDFSPEVRELYRFLDSGLRCNVPIWIGEGGSDPVANSIFYEIAATYDIGYALWCWKVADDPKEEAKGCVRYPLPEKWELIRNYVRNGGPRPSYKEAQAIMDELLEKMKPQYCKIAVQDSRYNLRQPGIVLPAVGFDQGSAIGIGWIYGNAFGYRTEEGMKMTVRPGVKPPQRVVVPTGEPIRAAKAIKDLCLELRSGEQVSYTIRDVTDSCCISFRARAVEAGCVEIQCETPEGYCVEKEIVVSEAKTKAYDVAELSASDEWKVTIKAIEGVVQLDEIGFWPPEMQQIDERKGMDKQ